jgi:hypothetical protein
MCKGHGQTLVFFDESFPALAGREFISLIDGSGSAGAPSLAEGFVPRSVNSTSRGERCLNLANASTQGGREMS